MKRIEAIAFLGIVVFFGLILNDSTFAYPTFTNSNFILDYQNDFYDGYGFSFHDEGTIQKAGYLAPPGYVRSSNTLCKTLAYNQVKAYVRYVDIKYRFYGYVSLSKPDVDVDSYSHAFANLTGEILTGVPYPQGKPVVGDITIDWSGTIDTYSRNTGESITVFDISTITLNDDIVFELPAEKDRGFRSITFSAKSGDTIGINLNSEYYISCFTDGRANVNMKENIRIRFDEAFIPLPNSIILFSSGLIVLIAVRSRSFIHYTMKKCRNVKMIL